MLVAGFAVVCAVGVAQAQWDIEDSRTAASLRGVSSVGGGIAWASGTDGTVLRTEDGGFLWQNCAMPPGAEKLDFRGIQAFDEKTALVMSSGKGDLSRIYKTIDGCASWKLVVTNPDKDGFWDGIQAKDQNTFVVFGDPVNGAFQIRETHDGGATWINAGSQRALPQEGAFAASNSSLLIDWAHGVAVLGTGSPGGARLFTKGPKDWVTTSMAMFAKGEAAGIFSISAVGGTHLVAVGGDYKKPDVTDGNAGWSADGGKHWQAAKTLPHGFRSAVAYDAASKVWITVGPNGTDVSRDDGLNWRPLKPSAGEPADADRNWNALSLPFVVGPKGRIGKLRTIK